MFRKPIGRGLLDPFQDGLKWLGRTLGAVRDLDVSLAYLADHREAADAQEQAVVDRIMAEQRDMRVGAQAALVACLDSDRYRAFIDRFGDFLRSPWQFIDCPGSAAPMAQFAPRVLRKRLKAVRSYGRSVAEEASERLHALRIDCKHLRYAAEFVRLCYPKRLGSWIDRVTRVQDALGEIHDADVRVESLEAIAAANGHDGRFAEGVRRFIAFEQERRNQFLGRFRELWPRLRSKKFQRRLQRILAEPK